MASVAVLPAAVRERLRWFSLTPFDQSTAEGRAQERHRRVALTAAAAALAKVVSVGTALISIPLTLHYLGAERFGMWMTISSLIAMLAFADFGIANGVMSVVSSAHGRDDLMALRRVVASGFFLLVGIGTAVIAAFAAAYAFVPWPAVFNVTTTHAAAEGGPALAVFMACFAANIPLALVNRVQMGLQQGFAASLWQCVGSAGALAGVLWAIRAEAGLPWLVLALAGAPSLAALLNSLHFFFKVRPDLLPQWQSVSRAVCRQVAGTGALFFILQLVVAVAYSSDSIVIAQLMGAEAVAQYAVPEKLFGLIAMVIAMVLAPLWPAYGEAIARGDSEWVRATLKRSLTIAILTAAVLATLLVTLAPQILHLWVRDAVVPSLGLLVAFAVWKVIEAGGNAVAVFLNGAHVIRLQVFVSLTTAVAALALKIALVPIIGIAGAVWATVAAYVVFAAIPFLIFVPRLARNL